MKQNKKYDEIIKQLNYKPIGSVLLRLFGVGMHGELLLCGVCDEPTMHDTTNDKELICLVCNNVAKE